MRKTAVLDQRVLWTSLLILHAEDVEKLSTYVKARVFSLSECLLDSSKMGDPRPGRLFSFDQLFPQYLLEKKIEKVPPTDLDKKLIGVVNSVTMRFFNQPFQPSEQGV